VPDTDDTLTAFYNTLDDDAHRIAPETADSLDE
jgi:hypothetical protein